MISAVISVILTILILLFSDQILRLLFGKIEPDVMSACKTYLMITTWSNRRWLFMIPEQLFAEVSGKTT